MKFRTLLLTLFALLGIMQARADVTINETNFPDENFRNWLLEQDYGSDGVITDAEIAGITEIDVSGKGIASLKGIEFFKALTTLFCLENQLTSLDVSRCTALTTLFCYHNYLTSLDVSRCTALTTLDCDNNQLTSLNVSGCMALTTLDCDNNQLTSLDVSGCTALTDLTCSNNQLTSLDVSKNTALNYLYCYQNQINGSAMDALVESLPNVSYGGMYVIGNKDEGNDMTTTQVAAAKAKGWTPYYFGNGWSWQEYAGRVSGLEINEENFPDYYFRKWLLSQSYGKDGVITDGEIAEITEIDVYEVGITSLNGIEFFWALSTLSCPYNNLTSLDVSKNTALTTLWCYDNQLTSLDVSTNTSLTYLNCGNNQLTSLDVSKNTSLTYLNCDNNHLTSLDVSKNTALIKLSCYNNQFTSLDVSKNTALNYLYCYNNQIKDSAMDALVESLPNVSYGGMYVIGNKDEGNDMTTTQVAAAKAKGWTPYYTTDGDTWKKYAGRVLGLEINEENFPDYYFRNWLLSQSYGKDGGITDDEIAGITEIVVVANGVASLEGIEYFTALTKLWCCENQLTSLDVSKNTALTSLFCYDNHLTSLDVSKNTALTTLRCYNNQLTTLDVSKNTVLTELLCYNNQLTTLDVSKNTALTVLSCESNKLTSLDVSKNTALTNLNCDRNQIKYSGMDALVESLPNVSKGDMKVIYLNDGNVMTTVQVAAAKAKGWTPYYFNYTDGNGWSWQEYAGSVSGLVINKENFPDYFFLNWLLEQPYGSDGVITDGEIAEITEIDVYDNNITSLKGIEFFTALTDLKCSNNQLTSLDVSGCTALTNLNCDRNQLISLDVSKNTALTKLRCFNNQLTSLEVSGCTALTYLRCDNNQLASLDVSKNTALVRLDCYSNQLTSLDVSGCTELTMLQCYQNQIKGSAMNALVESLPSVSQGKMFVINNIDEGNVMTTTQVAAAKAKGWTPYYFKYTNNGWAWWAYAGSNPDMGDVNGDGEINVTDIVATVNYIMEKPSDGFNKEAADLNGDGEINVTDIVKMVTIIMSGGSRQDLQEVMSILKSHGFIFKGER